MSDKVLKREMAKRGYGASIIVLCLAGIMSLSAATVFVELIIRCDIRSSSDVTARNYSFFLSLTPPLVSNSIAAPMKLTDAKRNTRQLAARRTAA